MLYYLYRQQGHVGSETLCQQNPPVLYWRCRLTQVDVYNDYRTAVVVLFVHLCILLPHSLSVKQTVWRFACCGRSSRMQKIAEYEPYVYATYCYCGYWGTTAGKSTGFVLHFKFDSTGVFHLQAHVCRCFFLNLLFYAILCFPQLLVFSESLADISACVNALNLNELSERYCEQNCDYVRRTLHVLIVNDVIHMIMKFNLHFYTYPTILWPLLKQYDNWCK